MKNKYKDIIKLWKYVSRKRKTQLVILFILMILSVFANIISIGSIIPFLSALTNPDLLLKQNWFIPIIKFLNIDSKNRLLFDLTILFILASIVASLINILLLWLNSRISAYIGTDLKTEIFKKTLSQSYEYHISHNSSELISLVTQKVGIVIAAGILHVLIMTTAFVNSVAIILTLIIINPMVAISAFVLLGGGYYIAGTLSKKLIHKNGEIIKQMQPLAVKMLQEGLGGIREILLDNNQNIFIKNYRDVAYKNELASMNNVFLGNLPKSIMEVFSISLIAILAYYMQIIKGDSQVLPTLGALALGAQRLLPSLQQIYFSWSLINGNLPLIEEVVNQLCLDNDNNEDKKNSKLGFKEEIRLKNIYYKYPNSKKYVLNNLSLIIKKGQKVGFIGKTGSGKSTLVDIIMGLLYPHKGEMYIDKIKITKDNLSRWQKNIAHVPQMIFLSDASIAENIAFGIPKNEIDINRVKKAAKMACLDEFINNLPKGYDTEVGERGVQLSGGQRQRIGIARALYKQAKVIVFDEATSALDDETEKSVIDAINNLSDDLTIIMIAHRLTTLEECDLIYRLDNGKIVESGSYNKVIKNKDIA